VRLGSGRRVVVIRRSWISTIAALSWIVPFGGTPHLPALPSPDYQDDALQQRVLGELAVFTNWLEKHGVKGYVGEFGWPDNQRGDADLWNALATRWFEAADAANLWGTYWATGEWWGTTYILNPYEDRSAPAGLETSNTQTPVLEAHLSTPSYLRGIVVAGGEFGEAPTTASTSSFSNEKPGRYNRDYHYDTQATYDYLASRGIELVKIPFRWERLQRRPGGPLKASELGRLRGAVNRAGAAGLKVIVDMHNFGAYYIGVGDRGVRCSIGGPQCTIRDFADVWRRISLAFRDHPAVIGYTTMTEPINIKPRGGRTSIQVWQRASQAALKAIRNTGDTKVVLVSGYHWSGAHNWPRWNPTPWITDPADNFRYEVHHYWDGDHSGGYSRTYQQEVSASV
jgi:Cellulase (glycosyl hydrolase family 5)